MTDVEPMRIGRLARRTGVSVKALRFYDSQGLLFRAGRTAANYRLFPQEAIVCVETIRTLKAAGLTIRDARELAAARRVGGDPDVAVRRKLTQVLERLMRRDAELRTHIARLTELLRDVRALRCDAPGTGSFQAGRLTAPDGIRLLTLPQRGGRMLLPRRGVENAAPPQEEATMTESRAAVGAESLEQAVRQTVATIRQIDGYELFPHMWRLLGEGAPVPLDQLAAAVGWSVERVRETLRAHPAEWDDQGRLVGFGMTLRPTPHKFTFEDRSLYGWCASDTLMFPVLLGKPGLIESVCPVTRKPIRVRVAPDGVRSVDPREAVVSAVRPDRRVENVRTEICRLGHFFGSREAAAAWLEANPQGMLHTVEADFEIHRRVAEQQMGWSACGGTAC